MFKTELTSIVSGSIVHLRPLRLPVPNERSIQSIEDDWLIAHVNVALDDHLIRDHYGVMCPGNTSDRIGVFCQFTPAGPVTALGDWTCSWKWWIGMRSEEERSARTTAVLSHVQYWLVSERTSTCGPHSPALEYLLSKDIELETLRLPFDPGRLENASMHVLGSHVTVKLSPTCLFCPPQRIMRRAARDHSRVETSDIGYRLCYGLQRCTVATARRLMYPGSWEQ